MNMSMAISSIKTQLGLYDITLPFVDPTTKVTIPTENVIRDVIVHTTIPIYSQFVPWIRVGDINLANMKLIDRNANIYLLPAFLTTTHVQYVVDVRPAQNHYRGTYGDISPAYGINRSAEGVITAMEYMMVAGEMRAEPTFDYLGYNKIRLFGYPKDMITIQVACNHEPNGETIEDSCYDSFMQLAVLDVKEFLYNNLKYYKEIPSVSGPNKLEIDDFQNASSEKENLLEKWRDVFHLDMDYSVFM